MGTRKEEIKLKAQAERDARNKKAKRSRIVFQLGIVGILLAAATVIALVVVTSTGAASVTPANMAGGGVRFEGGSLTPLASKSTDEFKIKTAPLSKEAVDVRIYVDYLCPFCNQFEQTYGDYLTGLVSSGDVALEYHPISILDRLSVGTKYSTRAAAASACVADNSPKSWLDYNNALFANQPEENSEGLTDKDLATLATTAGASEAAAKCIIDGDYVGWAGKNTKAATTEIPFINQGLQSTPTITVNGKLFDGSSTDFTEYINGLIAAE